MILETTVENHARDIASYVAGLIKARQNLNEHVVLGLATGSTPSLLYREFVRLHKEDGLSFSNVYTFNLDEYWGIVDEHPESYHYFMYNHLFDHIDIPEKNIFIPAGMIERVFLNDYCVGYEKHIQELGGIDIQILGIGRTGHIGFNEPGSSRASFTRKVELNEITRQDAAPAFGGIEQVPTHAITMGMKTILSAKKIFFMSFGKAKKEITKKAFTGDITDEIPASYLQEHNDTIICVDSETNFNEDY